MKTLSCFLMMAALPGVMVLNGHAQSVSKPVVIGEEVALFSNVLKEERVLYISKPANYETTKDRYPVLFLLDGITHFHHTTGTTAFLARNQFMPDMLVVAIGNTDRARDMTPPSQDPTVAKNVPTHGGAANFQRFIADELIPWLDKNYRTRPYRILVGHSLGGLFAITSLITRPELFNAYIAISPSLQWDNQNVVSRAQAFFDKTDKLSASLYMTSGNEGDALVGGIRKLSGALEEKAPAGLEWHFEPMPLESHGSVPHRSTYQGLEFIFADWTLRNPFETYNKYGFAGIEHFFKASDKKYGTDRGVPESVGGGIAVQLENAGRLDEIVEMLARPSVVKPPPRFLIRIADQYLRTGSPEKAIELYRSVLNVDPANEAARQALTKLGK